jgi:GxxExxY protein
VKHVFDKKTVGGNNMLLYEKLSNRLVPAFYRVHKGLGPGLLESCYGQAMIVELSHLGISFECQQEFPVIYRLKKIGSYYADMVVENMIILEFKSVSRLNYTMEAQLLNYMGISGLSVGYLINFRNPTLEKKRFII